MRCETSTLGVSIWQTEKWGEMLLASKQVESIFDVEGIKIEKRQIGLGEYGFFILGVSSIVSFYAKGNKILNKLIYLAKKENVLFFQIETLNYIDSVFDNIVFDQVKEGYYKKFITPYTAIIDLKNSEEEILNQMKPKGRYNIKLATKKGVIVKDVEKNDENILQYYNLMLETTSRDSFSGNIIDYYKTFLYTLKNSKLLLAYVDDKVIAGGIFVFDKNFSIYYYGASTSDKNYRNLMAPYLLQWEAIKIAKSIGSKLYDFLGVASPDEKDSSLAGVTDFKLKLTGDVRKVSNSYIWINKKFKYNLIILFRYFKNLIKK